MNGDYLLQDYLVRSSERFPENVAIKNGNNKVTYKELMRQSIAVAENLSNLEMRQGDFVCLYAGKSIATVSAIFGVLFAGGAYIPLDTIASPTERCCDIIEQSNSRFLITTSEKLEQLCKNTRFRMKLLFNLHILLLDNFVGNENYKDMKYKVMDWDASMNASELRVRRVTSEDLAYILYTSGSTGKPKGVMLSHLNGRTFIDWCLSEFIPNETDHFISIAPFHFDLSIFDLYVSLACGGSLFIMPEEDERNPLKAILYLKSEQITYLYSVPSLWIVFMKYGKIEANEFPYLRKILYAGEPFPITYLKVLLEQFIDCEIYNLYGLIETNVFTYYKVKKEDCDKGIVPIGYECANSDAVVICEGREVTKSGDEGELCVRGSCVMKGYYNENILTQNCFIKSPVKRHHGDLLFRTGDIVRINEDGAFVFLGRTDFMIKKNGFRIELLEIEKVLNANENITEAIATGVKDDNGQIYIGVYIASKNPNMTVVDVKNYVAEKLPKYMVPDLCLFGVDIPRNSNGKADRQKITTLFSEILT